MLSIRVLDTVTILLGISQRTWLLLRQCDPHAVLFDSSISGHVWKYDILMRLILQFAYHHVPHLDAHLLVMYSVLSCSTHLEPPGVLPFST